MVGVVRALDLDHRLVRAVLPRAARLRARSATTTSSPSSRTGAAIPTAAASPTACVPPAADLARHADPAGRRARVGARAARRPRRRLHVHRRRRHVGGRLLRGPEPRRRATRAARSWWCSTTGGRSPPRPSRQTAASSFAAKAEAVGALGVRVDGNDVLAVHDAATHARGARAARRPGAARARHVPHGRAHQLRRPDALRPRRRARGDGARATRSSCSDASSRATGDWSDDDRHDSALDAVEARLERIIDAALGAPVDTASRASTTCTRPTTPRLAAAARRPRRGAPATSRRPEACRGEP